MAQLLIKFANTPQQCDDCRVWLFEQYCSMTILENVEHCGGEPEQADTGYYVIDR